MSEEISNQKTEIADTGFYIQIAIAICNGFILYNCCYKCKFIEKGRNLILFSNKLYHSTI